MKRVAAVRTSCQRLLEGGRKTTYNNGRCDDPSIGELLCFRREARGNYAAPVVRDHDQPGAVAEVQLAHAENETCKSLENGCGIVAIQAVAASVARQVNRN